MNRAMSLLNPLTPLNPRIRNWRGLRVWLVGASSGIGEALAHELLARGARVVLSARREDVLRKIADEAPDPQQVLVAALDITDMQQVLTAQRQVFERWNGIDLTIVLAATYQPMDTASLTIEAARPILRVNLEGVYNLLAALLPTLRRTRTGHLAIVSSVAGYRGLPRSPVYGPSKAALNNLTESLYLELRPLGIGVSLVNPGFVQTPLTALNEFPMPAIITPGQAAREILRGLSLGRFEIHFPARFTLAMKILALLPARLYFWLTGRITGATEKQHSSPGAEDPITPQQAPTADAEDQQPGQGPR